MRFFKDVYLKAKGTGKVVPKEHYKTLFDKTTLKESDFNRENFIPGSGGQTKLYNQLIEESKINTTLKRD